MPLNHPCPLLRNIYDMLLDEWYADQHFDSPVLDQLRQIERECGTNGLGMESKLNGIEMRKFETKEELVEWIETMHLQNTNGRETEEEMFRLGIEAAIEELTEFNLFSIPVVVGRSEQLPCDCGVMLKETTIQVFCPKCYIVVAEFENLIMNIEREVKVRDAIKYCIENFDSQTATNRIVEFWKDELKLQEQQCNIANAVGRSEQLVCDACGSTDVIEAPHMGKNCNQCHPL